MTESTMVYGTCGVTTLSEFLDDCVVYRNLEPACENLQGLRDLWPQLGLDTYRVPRKTEPLYAQLLAMILRSARALDSNVPLRNLLFIGDTAHNDGTAFRNLKAATGWPGYAFIGRDTPAEPPRVKMDGDWYVANRWGFLPAFLDFVQDNGISLDAGTAVVIDLDKTSLGARGRNDKVIDRARVDGVERTVSGLLASRFDPKAFVVAYDELNQSEYHPFTSDNQDYLAYICLMLGAGLWPLAGLVDRVRQGRFGSFHDFIVDVDARRDEVSAAGLLPIHEDVWANVQAGDPTPFKAFRYNEYLTTVACFGDLPGAEVGEALAQRIVITQEVREAAQRASEAGALCFGVSDKPDEASLPRPGQEAVGYLALHRLPTLAVEQIA